MSNKRLSLKGFCLILGRAIETTIYNRLTLMLIKDDQEMSLLNPHHHKTHKRHKRSDSFHQKQVRFFCFLLGLVAVLLIVGLIWLLNRSPASLPVFR